MTTHAPPTPTPIAPEASPRSLPRPLQIDWVLLGIVLALLTFGLIMVYSTTFDYGYLTHGDRSYFFRRQIGFALFGLFTLGVAALAPRNLLKLIALPSMFLALVLLIIVPFVGEVRFGANRTLFQGSYQPSELIKLTTLLYLSYWLHTKADKLHTFQYGLLPFIFVVGPVVALILLQPDLSAAITVVTIAMFLFFIAGAELLQIVIVALGGGLAAFIILPLFPTGRVRIEEYLTGLNDITQASFHVQQGIVAFVTGGFFGRGLGQSHQKFSALPTPHTDSIFAIVGEELGVLGATLLIVLFGLLVWRGMGIALKSPDRHSALLAAGITFWVAFEALVNMGVVVAAVPFAGNALPFISYGGSSLVINLTAMGILLNLSRGDPTPKPVRRRSAVVNHRRWNWRTRVSGPGRRQ